MEPGAVQGKRDGGDLSKSFPVVSSESLYSIFSNSASSLRCVFCNSSPVPLEKHLVIKIIKANSGLFSPFDAVAVCWRNTSK